MKIPCPVCSYVAPSVPFMAMHLGGRHHWKRASITAWVTKYVTEVMDSEP